MKHEIIALAGRAGAGKDAVAAILAGEQDRPGWVVITGFSYALKRGIGAMFGIHAADMTRAEKEERIDWLGVSPRELMQTLGTEWGRSIHPDLWIKVLANDLRNILPRDLVIITDARFPNEVAWVKQQGGQVWWVERDGIGPIRAHVSEESIGPQDCDRMIVNLGTLEDLQVVVAKAWRGYQAEREAA